MFTPRTLHYVLQFMKFHINFKFIWQVPVHLYSSCVNTSSVSTYCYLYTNES